jgi:hypothetical protein
MLIVGSKIKLVRKMGVFDNIGEICEVTDIQEGGVICFKFGGCHLGCMSYDEYEKYFEKVETPVKRIWSKWSVMYNNRLIDINGKERYFIYQVRENGKRVQVKCGLFKAEATCCKDDTFDFDKGLALAEKRLIVKLLNNQVNEIAKSM